MANITASDIADIAATTLSHYQPMKIVDFATSLQEYVFTSRLLRKDNVKPWSGQDFTFDAITGPDNNARMTGLFAQDNVSIPTVFKRGTVPWRILVTGWAIERREIAMNRGDREQVQDIAKGRQYAMRVGLFELIEAQFCDEPTASSDTENLFGLPYWLVYNATEGFNGGNNAIWSSGKAGIDQGTYSRYANWTFNYTSVNKADLVTKMTNAYRHCGFKGIINPPIPNLNGNGTETVCYTTSDTLSALEIVLEQQNDNLKNELAPMFNKGVFMSVPLVWVPKFDELYASQDPVVGINWSQVQIGALKGEWMIESPVEVAPNQHTVMRQFLDCTLNIAFTDLRKCFLGAKATWH
jgi:hypothetical protein